MSEKITFQTNSPVEVSLQYLEGKPVDSQFGGVQHLFSTTDSRVFHDRQPGVFRERDGRQYHCQSTEKARRAKG